MVDIKVHEDDTRVKDEKEDALEARRVSMVTRCDKKIARRRSLAERREADLAEELSRAQAAVNVRRGEIEVANRLAVELSRRKKTEEVKRALKLDRVKPTRSTLSCYELNETRSHLIKERVHLEANQTELSKLWHEDEGPRQAEDERKKRNLRDDLLNQLADNRRRAQQRGVEEKAQDCNMIKQAIQKIQEEDARTRKKKEKDAILLRAEMSASLAAKKAWERKYKEALKNEDERIVRVIAEKEARREKQIATRTELRATREAAIDNVAKKLLASLSKERMNREIANELYRAEQRSEWTKESVRPASRKQCDAEYLQEMMARQKAECKARDEATEAAFARYLVEKRLKDIEKQRKDDKARHAKKIQYGEELKEIITNNRVKYAMDILERQSEMCAHDNNANQLIATSTKSSNCKRKKDNNKIVNIKT